MSAKKGPKLGIQIPNAGDDNQSCHTLTVIFDQSDWLRVPKYNIYSSNLFYTNVSISTSLQGCDIHKSLSGATVRGMYLHMRHVSLLKKKSYLSPPYLLSKSVTSSMHIKENCRKTSIILLPDNLL